LDFSNRVPLLTGFYPVIRFSILGNFYFFLKKTNRLNLRDRSHLTASTNFRAKIKEWQRLPYVGPYEEIGENKSSKARVRALEKRVVAIIHEFLSLTVEKMVEVEKISQFRKWFGRHG